MVGGGGWIGRQRGFRFVVPKAWGFKSLRPHQPEMEGKTMQVTELPAGGLKRQFKIVVPAGDLSAKVDERLAEMGRTAQMPGCRAGEVPVDLLETQYVTSLLGEAVEQAVN